MKKSEALFDFQKSLKKTHFHSIPGVLRTERYFTRPLASLIVKPLMNTSVHPDHLTWAGFGIGLFAVLLFSMGTGLSVPMAGFLMQLSSIFDAADGMLARSKGLCSRNGAFLDLTLDRILDFGMCMSVLWAYSRRPHSRELLVMGILFMGLFMLEQMLYYIYLLKIHSDIVGDAAEYRGLVLTVVMILSFFNRLDLIIMMMGLIVLIGIPLQLRRLFAPLPQESDAGNQSECGPDK